MLETIKLHSQLCIGAIKIQNALSNNMLSSKFETRELSPSQCAPKLLFFLCLTVAKIGGDLF